MRMYNRNVAYSTTIYIAYMVSLQKKGLTERGKEQNREEGEMAQEKLGGGRNRGKK